MNIVKQQLSGTSNLTSVEIAELTGKRHHDVMRDIEKMFKELEVSSAEFSAQYQDATGRMLPCYSLPPIYVKTLVTGYDVKRRHKVILRLEELESKAVLPVMTQAQMLAAIATQAAEQDLRVTAIEAKVKLIEANLPQEQDYFTIIGWARYIGTSVSNSDALVLGRRCATLSRRENIRIGDTTDPRYGTVHTYHRDVLDTVFENYFAQ